MTSRRLSPFASHRQTVLAAKGARVIASYGVGAPARAGANDGGGPVDREAALIRLQLIDHEKSLKAIQSRESKIVLKAELLPLYEAWISGVLAGNSGQPDHVFTTMLIWKLDVGLFIEAVPMIDYVLRHRLELPSKITRTPATFITEEIATAALRAFDQGGDVAKAFPAGVLAAVEDLVDHEDPDLRQDMPDEVRAKLQKAIGRAILVADEDDRARQEQALKRFKRALDLDGGAGVKKEIDQLTRKLAKPEATNTPDAKATG